MYTHIPQRAAAEIPARMCVPLAPTANALRRCRSQGGASANTPIGTYAPGASFRYSPDRRFLLSCCHSAAENPREKTSPLVSSTKSPPPKNPNPRNLTLRTKSYGTCAPLRPCSQMEQIWHRGFCRRARHARLPGNWVPAEAPSQWRFRFPGPHAGTKPQGWR